MHLIYRLNVGGLERFMVDMVNRFPDDYEHVIVSLTDASDFKSQVNESVPIFCLGKAAGQDLGVHLRLAKLVRKIQPDILHTYNLATIEYHLISRLVGVRGHLHAEHGREISDPEGLNWKHNLLRRLMSPFIQTYVAVSEDLKSWLVDVVGIAASKVEMIPNGIDLARFDMHPGIGSDASVKFVHVARLQAVKNQRLLLSAFDRCWQECQGANLPLPSLTVVGDGPDRSDLESYAKTLGACDAITFAGMQTDVAAFYRRHDVFVLSSVAEGTPMTILEAMATGLPIISTDVGGIPQLVNADNGWLVPSNDIELMSEAMLKAIMARPKLSEIGACGRALVQSQFNQSLCDDQYQTLYKRAVK